MTAYLLFDESIPPLPTCVEHLLPHLRKGDAPTADIPDGADCAEIRGKNGFSLRLQVGETHGAPSLKIDVGRLHKPEEDCKDLLPRLAFLTYQLVKSTPAKAVIWPGTETELPRADFLDGLETSFASVRVVPRRIARPGATPTADLKTKPQTARPRVRAEDITYDAHISAYHSHLRHILTCPASEEDLARARAERPERSTWAALEHFAHWLSPHLSMMKQGRLAYGTEKHHGP